MNKDKVVACVQNWVQQWVVGKNLCPFANAPLRQRRVAFQVYTGADENGLIEFVLNECRRLFCLPAEECETSLVIAPNTCSDFAQYLDVLDLCETLMIEIGWEGVFQLASFHPDYVFAGTQADAHENYTNRSPYPMFHILREASVSKAAEQYPDTAEIPSNNIRLLKEMSLEEILKLSQSDKA